MPEDERFANVRLRHDGSDLSAELHQQLVEVRVEESVQLPDAFTLRFDDPHFEIFDEGTFAMGDQVEIAFRAEAETVVVTVGEITTIAVEPGPSGRHVLALNGLDTTHRLHRQPHSQTYVQMTDADIAAQVAERHGLDTDVEATSEVHPYAIQNSQTDYAFLRQRGARIGYDLWITEETLHFRERPSARMTPPELVWGSNLHRFKVRFSSAERADSVTVRAFDPAGKREVVGRASEPERGTTAAAAEEIAAEARAAFGEVARSAGHLPATTQGEADALAASLMARASGSEVVARGEADGNPLLAAGATATVTNVGSRLAGDYTLTTVEHLYRQGAPFITRFTCGAKEPAGLADLVGGGGSNGEASRGWGSLVLGTVTNVDDPQGLGRVKVKFVDLEDTESQWAPVVSFGAGSGRGAMWLPEVGDTVVVGFEHDDKQRPLMLGGIYSQEDPPPGESAVQGGEVVRRTLSSRVGHRVELDDSDPGKVVLAMGDADSRVEVAQADTVVHGEQSVTVDGVDVTVEATGTLTLKGSNVEISAAGEVKVDGAIIRLN